MPDMEKIIKGLELCKEDCGLGNCPYWNGSITDGSCMIKLHDDALAMIDTQHKLILELQNLISIGTKMMNGDEA